MKNNYIFIVVLLFSLITTSCSSDFLELEPNNEISETAAFANKASVEGVLNGIMATTIDNSGSYRYMLTLQGDVLSGNLKRATNAGTSRWQSESVFAYTPSATNSALWLSAYQAVVLSNKVLNKVDGVADMNKEEKNRAKGIALFMRALSHFNLLNVYAQTYTLNDSKVAVGADGNGGHLGVPLILETTKDLKPERSSVKLVYDQIITDLMLAETIIGTSTDVFMPTKLSVQALLSRVYLYKGDNANCLIYSNKALAAKNTLLAKADYLASWNEDSSIESIFSLPIYKSHPYFPTNGLTLFDLLAEDGTYGDLSVTTDLYSLFEKDDVRKSLYYMDSRDNSVIRTNKYRTETSNVSAIRVSEMYLNKAEVLLATDESAALTTINLLRTARGLSNLNSSGNQLKLDIYKERRLELAMEGHLIYDLTRTHRDLDRDDMLENARKDLAFPSKYFVLPIPEAELNGNSNCVQNPY